MKAIHGSSPVLVLRGIHARWLVPLGFSCLVCACGSDDPPNPNPTPATGGLASVSGGAIGNGGAPAAGSGGTTGGSSGGSVAGSGGTTGGSGSGSGSGGAPVAGSGGTTGGSSGGSVAAGSGGTAGSGAGAFTLTSPAFETLPGCAVEAPASCDVFPDENVAYEERPNLSPALSWAGVPPGTQSFALVLMDATYGQAHWALWNIPADARMLAANVAKDTATPPSPPGSRQANANFATHGGDGYFGPHVPCNVFELQLYALSTPVFSPMDSESAVLVAIELQNLGEPVLGLATLIGRSADYGMTCAAP